MYFLFFSVSLQELGSSFIFGRAGYVCLQASDHGEGVGEGAEHQRHLSCLWREIQNCIWLFLNFSSEKFFKIL